MHNQHEEAKSQERAYFWVFKGEEEEALHWASKPPEVPVPSESHTPEGPRRLMAPNSLLQAGDSPDLR